jgi:hypothetical protein
MELSADAQAAVDAVVRLDTNLSAANQALQTAAELHTEDTTTITALKAKASINPIPPVFGGRLPNILVGLERLGGWKHDTDHDLKLMPHNPAVYTPAADGWTDVAMKPAGKLGTWPSDNNYPHWDGIGPRPDATMFALYGEFSLPTAADVKACQAVECQIEQCINGTTFDTCAWQFPLGGGKPFSSKIRYFDKVRKWMDSPVPFDQSIMQAGKVVSILAESTVDHAAGAIHMTALTVNGQRTEFDLVVPSKPNQFPGANYIQVSTFQTDSVQNAPYRLRIRNCTAMWL